MSPTGKALKMNAPAKRLTVPTMHHQSIEESMMTGSEEVRADRVKTFSRLLGSGPTADSSRMKELTSLLSSNLQDDDVVLTVPSLDLRMPEGEVLPGVGEHSSIQPTGSAGHDPAAEPQRPDMAASVLQIASGASKSAVEYKAAQNIGKPTSWTKSTVSYAAIAMGSNLSDSFSVLVNSRLRAWTLVLLKHSLKTGDGDSRSKLLSMLQAKIKPSTAETAFKTLPLPKAAAGKPKQSDIILPLLLEVILHIHIQDRPETVTIRAPGTVSAHFDGDSDMLRKVQVRLDTGILLSSMVDQARVVVLKAVCSATKTPVHDAKQPGTASPPPLFPVQEEPESSITTAKSLSGFRSALNLSPAVVNQSERLQKARSSALQLNSVLHGKTPGTANVSTGPRKVRSVKWDNPLQLPKLPAAETPDAKKQRMAANAAKLKSFKSFGRPHAGDFGSGPKNATFGEFGRPSAGVWGRDGRLAQHPVPMQSAVHDDDQMGLTAIADKNATFDLKPRQHPSRSVAAAFSTILNAKRSTSPTTRSASTASSIPRSATVLENAFMEKLNQS